jgi:hypothetical protein
MHHSVRKARTISSDEGYRQEHPGKNIGIAERLPKPLPWLPHEDRLRPRREAELRHDAGLTVDALAACAYAWRRSPCRCVS